MPGCQVTFTVINEEGKTIADNPDVAAQRKARTCESCHSNLKTAGLGLVRSLARIKGIV